MNIMPTKPVVGKMEKFRKVRLAGNSIAVTLVPFIGP